MSMNETRKLIELAKEKGINTKSWSFKDFENFKKELEL